MNQDYKPGILTIVTSYIFFFMAMNLFFFLSIISSLAWLLIIESSLLNFIPISLIGPSITALLCCMIKFKETNFEKEDLPTAKDFMSFYKKNFMDTLKIWTPYVILMVVLYTNATYYDGSQFTRILFTIVALIGSIIFTLSMIYMLMINAKFKFGSKDLFKLSLFYILTDIKATLSIVSVCILSFAVAVLLSDLLLLLVASEIGYLLVKYTYSMLEHVKDRFIEDGAKNKEQEAE